MEVKIFFTLFFLFFYYTVLYSIQTIGVNFAQYLVWMTGSQKKATVIAFQGKLQSMGTTSTGVLSQATTCSTVEDITTDAIQQ